MKFKVFVCFLLIAALCAGLFGCGGSDWEDPARTTVGSDWEDPNRTDWEDPVQTTTVSDWEDPGKTDWEDVGTGYAPQLASASAGSVVLFGRYEQDNDLSNGAEPIAWQVLTREGNRIFVVSVYALECLPYNTEENKTTSWEDCTLRKWLNEDFLSTAFTAEERDAIPAVEVPPGDNYIYEGEVDFGRATRDRVFCLSASELYAYLDTDGDYHNPDEGYYCEATAYAQAMGAAVLPSDKWGDECVYWLRGPGHEANYAMTCDAQLIGYFGLVVWMTDASVRPAMWINVGEG